MFTVILPFLIMYSDAGVDDRVGSGGKSVFGVRNLRRVVVLLQTARQQAIQSLSRA